MDSNKDVLLNLKITKKQKEELEKLAKEDNRTLSNFVYNKLFDVDGRVRK